MKKIVRLTESDLVRLVNKVIEEQQTPTCVTSKEMVDLLLKFKFKVIDQTSTMIVLKAGGAKGIEHNIKDYTITIMVFDKKIKFKKTPQEEINSPIPSEPYDMVKNFCDFKTINDFRRFVIDKFMY